MKRTPLYSRHIDLGAQMTDFGGFEMPVRYSGDKTEHLAVRQKAGIFDVSHMGEIIVSGPKAEQAVDMLLTNDATKAANGQAFYAAMLNDRGTIIDDVVAYKFSPEKFLICVNASNREKDAKWISTSVTSAFSPGEAAATDQSDIWSQIAIQGPSALPIMAKLSGTNIFEVKRYHFVERNLDINSRQVASIIARTGYTGEDGFELFVHPDNAVLVWNALLEIGEPFGILPCGLAARDTLRLEAGMCLYGNDIDETTTPLEANLGWAVKFDKTTPFIGQEALLLQKKSGIQKRLCGLEMIGKGIARHGHGVLSKGQQNIGQITSGTLTPFLNRAIAMAHVHRPYFEVGTEVDVDIRGRSIEAKIVKMPFYRRQES